MADDTGKAGPEGKEEESKKPFKAIMFVADAKPGRAADLDIEVVAVKPDVMSAIVARRC